MNRFFCVLLFLIVCFVYYLVFRGKGSNEEALKLVYLSLVSLGSYLLMHSLSSLVSMLREKPEDKKKFFITSLLEKEPFFHALVYVMLLPIGTSYVAAFISLLVALLLSEIVRQLRGKETFPSEALGLVFLFFCFRSELVPYLDNASYGLNTDTYLLSDITTSEKLSSFLFTPLSLWESYIGLGYGPIGARNILLVTIFGIYLSLTKNLNDKRIFVSLVSYYIGLAVFFFAMQDGSYAFPDALRLFFYSDYAFIAVFLLGSMKLEEKYDYLISLSFSFFTLLFQMLCPTLINAGFGILLSGALILIYSFLPDFKKNKVLYFSLLSILIVLNLLVPLLLGLSHPMNGATGVYL